MFVTQITIPTTMIDPREEALGNISEAETKPIISQEDDEEGEDEMEEEESDESDDR
jgi:hypothetical protein